MSWESASLPAMADMCSICWDCLGLNGGVAKTRCGEVLSCLQCLGTGFSFCGWRAASRETYAGGAFWLTDTQKHKFHGGFCLAKGVPVSTACPFHCMKSAASLEAGLPSFYCRSPFLPCRAPVLLRMHSASTAGGPALPSLQGESPACAGMPSGSDNGQQRRSSSVQR